MEEVQRAAHGFFDVRGDIKELGGERDRNFLIASSSDQVLIKVANPAEDDSILEMQCMALEHIKQHAPELPTPVLLRTNKGLHWGEYLTAKKETLRVRAFHYLPGNPIGQGAVSGALLHNLGQSIARLNLALRSFTHPAAQHLLAWNVQCFDQMEGLLAHVKAPDELRLITTSLEKFKDCVKPQLPLCRHQVIHNDISFHNTVTSNNHNDISGIFDFGDMVFGPVAQDLANAAAELPAGTSNPLAFSTALIAGYHSISPLEEIEIALLPDLISARLALCLVLEAWADTANEWQDDRDHLDGWAWTNVWIC